MNVDPFSCILKDQDNGEPTVKTGREGTQVMDRKAITLHSFLSLRSYSWLGLSSLGNPISEPKDKERTGREEESRV